MTDLNGDGMLGKFNGGINYLNKSHVVIQVIWGILSLLVVVGMVFTIYTAKTIDRQLRPIIKEKYEYLSQ